MMAAVIIERAEKTFSELINKTWFNSYVDKMRGKQ